MRAYVSRLVDGRTTCGTENNSVSREYKSQAQLLRFGVLPLLREGQDALIEVFLNWDNRYGKPDNTIQVRKTGVNTYILHLPERESYRSSKLRPA